MSDSSSLPISVVRDGDFDHLDLPPAVGWVVHTAEGKPQNLSGLTHWAWCKVEAEQPGYSEIVFTYSDGATPADPYPNGEPTRLGPVLFKVFC